MPEEENFPKRSPTRDAVEREMREPGNLRGPAPARPRAPPAKQVAKDDEADELGDGSPAVDDRQA